MCYGVYSPGGRPLLCGYVTDPWKGDRERAERLFGGKLVDFPTEEGYCILSDGSNLLTVRLSYMKEIYCSDDPLPDIAERKEVFQFAFDKGVISMFDYFSWCDNDWVVRLPALQLCARVAQHDRQRL